MLKKVTKIFNDFSGGLADGTDTSKLRPNQFVGVNVLPAEGALGSLDKVRIRHKNLFSLGGGGLDDTLNHPSTGATITNATLPRFDLISNVYSFITNWYKKDTYSTNQTTGGNTVTYVDLYNTTKANMLAVLGFYIHESVLVTAGSSFNVSTFMKLKGTYDPINKHKLSASIRYYSGDSGTWTSIGLTVTFVLNIASAEGLPTRVTFSCTSASDTFMAKGEYALYISDGSGTGATSTQCYQLAVVSAVNGGRNGCVTTDTGAEVLSYAYPMELMAWTPVAIYSNQLSASLCKYMNQGINLDVATVGSPWPGASGGYLHNKKNIFLSDRFSVFDIFDTSDGSNAIRKYDTAHINSMSYDVSGEFAPVQKHIGKISGMLTYQEKLVLGGIGGISISDTARMHMDNVTANVASAVPDIGGRGTSHAYLWLSSGYSQAVYPPFIRGVFSAGINTGRIYAFYEDVIMYSGGITAATSGNPLSWSVFAKIQFGDSTDEILFGSWWRGYILLFTMSGDIYYLNGEPPVDPTLGMGTLHADLIAKNYGVVSHVEQTPDGIFFATDSGTKLHLLDLSMVPKRIDSAALKNLSITSLDYDAIEQQLWVSNQAKSYAGYLATPTNDATLAYKEQVAGSYVFDKKTRVWYKVVRPYESDATGPTTVICRKDAWKCGTKKAVVAKISNFGLYNSGSGVDATIYNTTWSQGTYADVRAGDLVVNDNTGYTAVVRSVDNTYGGSIYLDGTLAYTNVFLAYATTLTIYSFTDHASVETVGDDLFYINPTTANSAEPENSTYRAVDCTADIYTQEVDLSTLVNSLSAVGQLREAYLVGYLHTGTTAYIYLVDQNNVETLIDTLTGDQNFAAPLSRDYFAWSGNANRTGSVRLHIQIVGPHKDRVRAIGFTVSIQAINSEAV